MLKEKVMTHASIFSGIGGAELAASWMGWQNLFHCEIREFPRKVLEYWYPNSISYDDIKKTDFNKWRGQVDVLTGGFPCQPFSVAGNRLGAKDDRYLWVEMLRAIRQIQPSWVVGENVAGIISMVQPGEEVEVGRKDNLFEENYVYRKEQEYTLSVICKDIESAGYAVQPFIVPACAVGAPHRRDRVWIVAHTDSNRQRNGKNEQIFEQKCKRTTDIGKMCDDESSPDPHSAELKRERQTGQDKTKPDGHNSEGIQAFWQDFPTQPPVCSRDDGLPFDVADLTIPFPKWRQEAVAALGNAWVPQVAYMIFNAIEQIEAPRYGHI